MVGKLIGERGKSIAEITRDSKVKINIPKVDSNEKQVVISITGQKENIKTAQYLMQKLLKGQKYRTFPKLNGHYPIDQKANNFYSKDS